MFINKNLEKIIPYKLSSHEAWDFTDDSDTLKLDWNEATVKPSPKVIKRILKVINNGKLNWYPNINNVELINKIANYNSVKSEQVQYFASSDSLHEYIVRAFINSSDIVLSVSPTYDNFRAVAESHGANIHYYNLDSNFNLDFKKLNEDLILIKPKVVYIVNPNNPTGTLYNTEELSALINKNRSILFIIDEAYYEFSKKTMSIHIGRFNNLMISRTFSKAFALASFRIGYLISSETNIEILNRIRNPKNISLFAQEAALAALEDLEYTENYVSSVLEAKIIFTNYLKELKWIKYYKGSGNFIFIKLKNNQLKNRFIKFLKQNKIFIRDYGHLQSTKNFVRITIGTKSQMKLVINQIKDFKL